jgi:acylphosphatase
MPTVQLLIKGRVQGVYFRATAKQVADALNVTGWIRNTPDGDVEAMGSGSEDTLRQFIQWCKTGPEGSSVQSIDVMEKAEMRFNGFSIQRS